jgi:hypothetical protein
MEPLRNQRGRLRGKHPEGRVMGTAHSLCPVTAKTTAPMLKAVHHG